MLAHRKALIAAATLAAALVAGAVAVGANVGILGGGTDSTIGDLSAASVTTAAPRVIDVYDGGSTTAPQADTQTRGQTFAVDAAGTVTLDTVGSHLTLTKVTPSDGWSWRQSQNAPDALSIELTDGSRTVRFDASRRGDGSIDARVAEVGGSPGPSDGIGARAGSSDRVQEDREHEDEEHENQAHEYEGHEDDD